MNKKMMTVLIILAVVCSALFLMTSCATKKATMEEEEVTPAPPPGPTQAELDARAKAEADAKARAEADAKARAEAAMARQEMEAFESIHIYFDFDKSELTAEARDVLVQKADYLKKNPTFAVRIEGNCDDRGTNEYNLALGERRANAAQDFLATLGVSKDRMSTLSYGEEKPIDPRSGEEAWAKNRNDQFVLVK